MQIKVKAAGKNGRFVCCLGEFVAFHDGTEEQAGEFFAEIDTDDVFAPGGTLFVLDETRQPSISITDGANVMVGQIGECFENQTAVLDLGGTSLIFDHEGDLEVGRWVLMKANPFSIFAVNI